MSLMQEFQHDWMVREVNKEALRDFRSDFQQVTDVISGAYGLDGEIWNSASLQNHGIKDGYDDLGTYLVPGKRDGIFIKGGFLIKDQVKLVELVSEMYGESKLALVGSKRLQIGSIGLRLDRMGLFRNVGADEGKLTREQALGALIRGAALTKALLRKQDGIREVFGKAREQANDTLKLYEKAAEVLFENTYTKSTYDIDDLLETVAKSGGLGKIGKTTTLLAGTVLLTACAGGMPTETKPNFVDPTLTIDNPPAVSSPAPSDDMETPTAGMTEFESNVAASFVQMDKEKIQELRNKFNSGEVVFYEVGVNPETGKPSSRLATLTSQAKESMQLRDGVVISEPGGGEWECLIYETQQGDITIFDYVCNTEKGMFIPSRIYDPAIGIMSWSFYIDAEGNYPVDFNKASIVRPVIQLKLGKNNQVEKGWMWSKKDGKLHEIIDIVSKFKSASPALNLNQYEEEANLERQYGESEYSWPEEGRPTLTFDNGMQFEWNGEEYVEVKEVVMTEADKQIFDAATEAATGIEDIKPELDPIWGVVSKNKDGEVEQYWKYFPYNYDKGEWVKASVGDGHLNTIDKNGKEGVVYPERITLNVNGKEITYNTTARGYKENPTPQTPEEYKAVIEALAQAITEGKVLMPFAEGALKITDLEKRDSYNSNGTSKSVYHIRSDKWRELTPDQIPYSPLAFPYDRDGLAVEGVVIVPVMLLDGDGKVTGFWAFKVVDNKWMKFDPIQEIQRLLDRDMINSGMTSMAHPVVDKTIEVCVSATDKPELDVVCGELFSQTSAIESAFATSIKKGEMDEQLLTGKLLPPMYMAKVAKAAKK